MRKRSYSALLIGNKTRVTGEALDAAGDAQEALVLKNVASLVPDAYTGFELADKPVGLIGCGRVAQALAMQIEPHCKCVLGYDSRPEEV